MNDTVFDIIHDKAVQLKVEISVEELAVFAADREFSPEQLSAVQEVFSYLAKQKHEASISTLLRTSRLPIKQPKVFDNFDFTVMRGKYADRLKGLNTLAPIYARKNLAFIGPQGVGKTHLAMAFGNECCQRWMKTYFLKASELNHRLTAARRNDRVDSVVNGLIKPSCLIIDEIGRTEFDRTNTRLFFDIIDRRYYKDGPNTIIFTSNKSPNQWRPFFNEDDDLLCALDRAFDDATVFMFKGKSYRGKKLETLPIEVGEHVSST